MGESDPDGPQVVYDLAEWSFDEQAELAAELAEAEVPHGWEGNELVVPELHEAAADAVIARVEERLGIGTDAAERGVRTAFDDLPPVPLDEGRLVTEYDLGDWSPPERDAVRHVLVRQRRPFSFDGDVLVVHSDDEDVVDSILDMIERGGDDEGAEVVDDDGDDGLDVGGRPPFETLTTFFLMAGRLRKDPLDADGLDRLLDALDVADPARPPYGVDPRLWTRTCEMADELAGALADADEPDHDEAMSVADELHDLLRPYV